MRCNLNLNLAQTVQELQSSFWILNSKIQEKGKERRTGNEPVKKLAMATQIELHSQQSVSFLPALAIYWNNL